MEAWERRRRWAAGLGASPAELAALAILSAGALAALGLLWLLGRPDPALLSALGAGGPAAGATPSPAAPASEGGLAVTGEPVVVHVAGEVTAPGLYRLPAGARVAEAIDAAGGATADAVLDALNLARPVTDGEQVVVPGPGQAPSEATAGAAPGSAPAPSSPAGAGQAGAGAAGAAGPPSGAWRPDGTLDLNRATAADLEELPGIGEVLAGRIIAHREAVGGFTAVSDLRDVPGIGEKTLATLAPLVGV